MNGTCDFTITISGNPPAPDPPEIKGVKTGNKVCFINQTNQQIRIKDITPVTHPPLFTMQGFPIAPNGGRAEPRVLATPRVTQPYQYKCPTDPSPVTSPTDPSTGIIIVDGTGPMHDDDSKKARGGKKAVKTKSKGKTASKTTPKVAPKSGARNKKGAARGKDAKIPPKRKK